MKKTMSEYSFVNEFEEVQDRRNSQNFTRAGLFALYDYFTEYEESTDTEINFDPIAICCDFSQYDSAWDAMKEYQPDDMPTIEDDANDPMDLVELQKAQEQAAREWLEDHTTVIDVSGGGVIIQSF